MEYSESRLVYDCMRELGKHGKVYRCNAGSVKLPNGKRFTAMPKGFADIMLIMPGGRAAFVECKARGRKSTPEQERFIASMLVLGARAGVAHSVDEALTICGVESAEGE